MLRYTEMGTSSNLLHNLNHRNIRKRNTIKPYFKIATNIVFFSGAEEIVAAAIAIQFPTYQHHITTSKALSQNPLSNRKYFYANDAYWYISLCLWKYI